MTPCFREHRTRQRETLERTVQDLLRHKHLTNIVQHHLMSLSIPRGRTPVQSWPIAWSLDSAALRAAQRLFGVTCFQTNAPTDSLATSDIIAWYRRKNRVEEAFHEIQSPLALRPLFVTRAQRIRTHVMACVLAYALYNTMEVRLRQHQQTKIALHGAESLGVQPDQSAAREIHGPNPPHDHRTHAQSTRLCVGAPV